MMGAKDGLFCSILCGNETNQTVGVRFIFPLHVLRLSYHMFKWLMQIKCIELVNYFEFVGPLVTLPGTGKAGKSVWGS
jgi:hypothetical protein